MTIRGQHTPAETRELLIQKDKDLAAMAKAFLEFEPKWTELDIDQVVDYRKDLEDLAKRWDFTKAQTNQVLAINTLTSEDAWQGILHTLQKTPGHFQKGDFPDLVQRLFKAGKEWRAPVQQPTAPDFDLDIYNTADKALKASSNIGLIVAGVLGVFGLAVLLKKI
jgi:hypothetical protein